MDIATLTGAIVTTLGTTYAGLMGQDDEWCEEVTAAGRRAGEIVWRLPLHADYAELIKGRYGDILNAVENRRAASVTAAEFLRRFVGDVPWAHLDIAGTAWDTGKAYAAKGGTGYGVRLLVQLASSDRSSRRYTGMAFAGEVFPEWYWGPIFFMVVFGTCRSRRPRSRSTSRSGAGSDGWPGLSAPHCGPG